MDADIYVLANNRNKEDILKVLNKYIPTRSSQMDTEEDSYEFWDDLREEGDQPSTFFNSEIELFDFLEKQSGILYRPSFSSVAGSEFRMLNLYYFEDDSLVIGLNLYQDSEKEDLILEELKLLLDSDYGYVAYHVAPEYGREAFIKQCELLD